MEQRISLKFYIAGPLKFESTRIYLDKIEEILIKNGFGAWSPYKDAGILTGEDLKNPEKVKAVLEKDIIAFHECDGAIFLLDGYYVGTIFELGYAYYLAKNVRKSFILIGVYTTVRGKETLDSMIKFCFEDVGLIVTSLSELEEYLTTLQSLKGEN
jgi:nucleoside 2-deoxyribosyltransferase